MRINASRVLARRPGSTAWVTLPVGLASQGSRAIVAGPVHVSWSRPTPRAHPIPGAISLSLICPPGSVDESLLDYDASIKIEVQLAPGRPWIQIVFGWISSIVRTSRADGRYVYALTLMDVLGRAAATKLGMSPRPDESRSLRIAAINSASPSGALMLDDDLGGSVMARDVDNAVLLDVIRDTCALTSQATEQPDGKILAVGTNVGPVLVVVKPSGYLGAATWYVTPILAVDAGTIEDTARIMDRTAVISQVSFRYGLAETLPGDAVEMDRTVKLGTGSFSSSPLTLRTDKIYRLDEEPRLTAWGEAIVRESSTPVFSLAGARVLLDRLPLAVAEHLIGLGTRDAAVVQIIDGPADLADIVVQLAGRVVLDGRDLSLVDVTLAAGQLYGFRPMATADLARFSTPPTFARLDPDSNPLAVSDLDVMPLANYNWI